MRRVKRGGPGRGGGGELHCLGKILENNAILIAFQPTGKNDIYPEQIVYKTQ